MLTASPIPQAIPTPEEIVIAFRFFCGREPTAEERERFTRMATVYKVEAKYIALSMMTVRDAQERWGYADMGRRWTPFEFTHHNGMKMCGPASDLAVTRNIAKSGYWEADEEFVMHALVKPGHTAVDIGANIGYFSATLSGLVGETGSVYAVEAAPLIRQSLYYLKEQNNLSQLHIIGAAGGLKWERLLLEYNYVNFGNTHLKPWNGDIKSIDLAWQIIIRAIPLDSVFLNLPQLNFIKIDVEGAESMVLGGMQGTLAKFQPDLLFEVFPDFLKKLGSSADALLTMIESHGYIFIPANELSEHFHDMREYALEHGYTKADILKKLSSGVEYINVLAIARK